MWEISIGENDSIAAAEETRRAAMHNVHLQYRMASYVYH